MITSDWYNQDYKQMKQQKNPTKSWRWDPLE